MNNPPHDRTPLDMLLDADEPTAADRARWTQQAEEAQDDETNRGPAALAALAQVEDSGIVDLDDIWPMLPEQKGMVAFDELARLSDSPAAHRLRAGCVDLHRRSDHLVSVWTQREGQEGVHLTAWCDPEGDGVRWWLDAHLHLRTTHNGYLVITATQPIRFAVRDADEVVTVYTGTGPLVEVITSWWNHREGRSSQRHRAGQAPLEHAHHPLSLPDWLIVLTEDERLFPGSDDVAIVMRGFGHVISYVTTREVGPHDGPASPAGDSAPPGNRRLAAMVPLSLHGHAAPAFTTVVPLNVAERMTSHKLPFWHSLKGIAHLGNSVLMLTAGRVNYLMDNHGEPGEGSVVFIDGQLSLLGEGGARYLLSPVEL
ncbi:hypothetical protein OG339_47450 (plasmid) [Streptosporangium sp. NBC_01495]|uniref:hypothetical protein n=1 Tax=Streptosporangium sp. NBC_01495 TaxID=2903899 RepID=UPI002E37B02F|nr:hypothetical protein [Streptosporangium sp. NBC_01495]